MDGAAFDQMVRRLEFAAGRRTLLAGLAAAGLAGGAAARPDLATARKKKRKVTICRKGQTLSVTKKKKRKHLKPGDTVGPCPTTTRPPATTLPPGTTLPPRCPAAKPNFCARLDSCQAACSAGHAFDAESCACVCSPAAACCVCALDETVQFHSALGSEAACQQRCADDGATFRDFKGGGGSAAAFDDENDLCTVTCTAEPMTCPAGVTPDTCSGGSVCCTVEQGDGCCLVDAPVCCSLGCCGRQGVCCDGGGCCSETLPLCCGNVCCLPESSCCAGEDDCDSDQSCVINSGDETGCCIDDPERSRRSQAASMMRMTPVIPRRHRAR